MKDRYGLGSRTAEGNRTSFETPSPLVLGFVTLARYFRQRWDSPLACRSRNDRRDAYLTITATANPPSLPTIVESFTDLRIGTLLVTRVLKPEDGAHSVFHRFVGNERQFLWVKNRPVWEVILMDLTKILTKKS